MTKAVKKPAKRTAGRTNELLQMIRSNPGRTVRELEDLTGRTAVEINTVLLSVPAGRKLAAQGAVAVSTIGKRPRWYTKLADVSAVPVRRTVIAEVNNPAGVDKLASEIQSDLGELLVNLRGAIHRTKLSPSSRRRVEECLHELHMKVAFRENARAVDNQRLLKENAALEQIRVLSLTLTRDREAVAA